MQTQVANKQKTNVKLVKYEKTSIYTTIAIC